MDARRCKLCTRRLFVTKTLVLQHDYIDSRFCGNDKRINVTFNVKISQCGGVAERSKATVC
ncbi:hypothetical protein CO178_00235 [candidate division WWE3 bacterium CG_4_9_14_3_um_filter_34_6]|uniref:Uncharacterized protein n=1 Tax=candidate division WWE3 bacterium CG_4_9_14_3_um_filter_34_6 TaxID=1975079 RepID=A0A2M7X5E3_UNCKA|nr:MAG: hypothetical protein CO178_00235 [candidate division WWE3 bacterium CG_4_9_14_3_um_filter_34_6]